jgi:hypothetical protein
MKKYLVTLTADEREHLTALIAAGKAAAKKLAHARILLKADQADGGPAWDDAAIAAAPDCGTRTVARVRKAFAAGGYDPAVHREKPTGRRFRKLGGEQEARLAALACSAPLGGKARWTLQLLADRLVEPRVVDAASDETVRRTLKKTTSSRGSCSSG